MHNKPNPAESTFTVHPVIIGTHIRSERTKWQVYNKELHEKETALCCDPNLPANGYAIQ